MSNENQVDYIEIPATDLAAVRDFFGAMFGWEFQMWGDDYMSFHDGRLNGGFRRASEPAAGNGVLLIFYSADLERDRDRVRKLGATISEDIFAFPGGRRFHFIDPAGNEYAIWSDDLENGDGA